jgi:hypothetical protein
MPVVSQLGFMELLGPKALIIGKLIPSMHGFQMTPAQVMCLCKGYCTSIPLLGFCVSFLQAIFKVPVVEKICLNASVIQFIESFHQREEVYIQPSKDTLEPSWERLHWLGDLARLSIDFDKMGVATWAIICSEYGEHTLVEHFDPFCGVVGSIADCHGEVQILGVFNIPLGASLEVFFISFNPGFKPGDLFLEVPLLFNMALFPSSDGGDQGGCNPMEGDCVNVCFHDKGGSDQMGGGEAFERGFLCLQL